MARVTPAPARPREARPGPNRQRARVERAAAERRKASAPEAPSDGNICKVWRAPRPQHCQVATSESVARPLTTRLPALRLPSFEAAVREQRGQTSGR